MHKMSNGILIVNQYQNMTYFDFVTFELAMVLASIRLFLLKYDLFIKRSHYFLFVDTANNDSLSVSVKT